MKNSMEVPQKTKNINMNMSVAQLCPTPWEPNLHGISQERILEWVAISSSGYLCDPGIKPESPVSPSWQMNSLPDEPHRKQKYHTTQKFHC